MQRYSFKITVRPETELETYLVADAHGNRTVLDLAQYPTAYLAELLQRENPPPYVTAVNFTSQQQLTKEMLASFISKLPNLQKVTLYAINPYLFRSLSGKELCEYYAQGIVFEAHWENMRIINSKVTRFLARNGEQDYASEIAYKKLNTTVADRRKFQAALAMVSEEKSSSAAKEHLQDEYEGSRGPKTAAELAPFLDSPLDQAHLQLAFTVYQVIEVLGLWHDIQRDPKSAGACAQASIQDAEGRIQDHPVTKETLQRLNFSSSDLQETLHLLRAMKPFKSDQAKVAVLQDYLAKQAAAATQDYLTSEEQTDVPWLVAGPKSAEDFAFLPMQQRHAAFVCYAVTTELDQWKFLSKNTDPFCCFLPSRNLKIVAGARSDILRHPAIANGDHLNLMQEIAQAGGFAAYAAKQPVVRQQDLKNKRQ